MKGHGTTIIKLVSTSGNAATKSATESKIGKICYVDDSRTSAYVTKKILKEYGYEVDFFPSAEPAVVAILENDYDLLLTDLTLSTGGMDGDELVRFLRNSGHPRKKLLPVIVITGTSDKETLLKIYEAGANGVLVKPITGEELHDRIRTLVPEKAYPGTPVGYALEIPQAPGQYRNRQATSRQTIPQSDIGMNTDSLLNSIGITSKTIPSSDVSTQVSTDVSTDVSKKRRRQQQQQSVQVSIPTNRQKKAYDSTDNLAKSNKQNKKPKVKQQKATDDTMLNSSIVRQIANKQKSKKLSILENLKLAATAESSLDLDLNQETYINTGEPSLQIRPSINKSKQHTQPTYKSTAHQKRIISERLSATSATTRPSSKEANDNNFIPDQADNIPILEPAGIDEFEFSLDSRGVGAPELKLEERPSTAIPKERTRVKKPKPQPQPEPEPAAEVEFDAEDVIGDKKIITALDINTDFSEFDDDVFRPSVAQSLFDTFRSFRILGLATMVSVAIISWSLWNYINDNEVVIVDVTRVNKGTLHQTINVPGRVVSKLNVNVTSSSSGQIVSVNVKEGEKVKKGQVLVKLENEEAISDVKRSEGNLLSAKEETALANKTLKRMRRALTLGAISRQQMEEAEASLKSAQAKENIATELRRTAQLSRDKLNVVAPFVGTVTAKYSQVGQWITPSDTLFTLTDLSQREVEVKVDASDSNSISVGQSVFMTSDSTPGKTWTESVHRIAAAANKNDGTNTVSVFISLSQDAPPLRMGQQADAEIRTFSKNNAIKLPISAVITRNGKSWVGTIKNGRAHFVPIETGMEDLMHVEVLQGLHSLQEVIIPQGGDLQEGDRVQISSTQAQE